MPSPKSKADKDTGEVLPRVVRRPWERERLSIKIEGPSRTHQAHKDLVDVNNIVRRYERTGQLPPGRQGQYGDVTALQGDLTERVNHAREVQKVAGEHVTKKRRAAAQALEEKKQRDIEDAIREKIKAEAAAVAQAPPAVKP